jgi:hypothetical protein
MSVKINLILNEILKHMYKIQLCIYIDRYIYIMKIWKSIKKL